MNLLRPISRTEDPTWVERLFHEGPHPGDSPDWPLTWPLPRRLSQSVVGGFVYVCYRGEVIGYGLIGQVAPHGGDTVGSEARRVGAGDTLVLDGTLQRMPFALACRSPRCFQYVADDLHRRPQAEAQAVLRGTRL